MSERVEIEVEYRVRAKIELPEGQDYPDFLDSPETWEDGLVNDLMHSGDTGEFSRYVKAIRVDTSDSTDDPDWMEL